VCERKSKMRKEIEFRREEGGGVGKRERRESKI
jgi:hypothetical protein